MAIKPEIWNEARIMFEGGKSLNEIAATTGIHKGNISKKSNSEGWIKGKLQPLINDSVRVATEKATLSNPEVAFVNNEIAEKTKHLQFIHNATLKNLSVQMKKVNDTTTHQEHKFVQESINKGGEALGVLDKGGTTINNTAQAAVLEDKKIIIIKAEEAVNN